MISVYIREQKRYTLSALVELFNCSEEKNSTYFKTP